MRECLEYGDIYTSFDIRKYEIQTHVTTQGPERITKEIPHLEGRLLRNLDKNGIVMLGSWVETGDILVGQGRPVRGLPAIGNGISRRGVGGQGYALGSAAHLFRDRGDEGEASHPTQQVRVGPAIGSNPATFIVDHPVLYTPFVLRTLVDSELRLRRNQTFDGPALFYVPLDPERKMSFAPLDAWRSRGSREGKRTHPLLHLARDDKERASSIDEQRIDGALGIVLFFSPFLSAKSNPVPQDPISAIHPPCIYAGDVASAEGFGLCRSKMMNGIVALHSPPMRKDAAKKNGTLLRSAGCVGSRITSELFTLKFKHQLKPAHAASAVLFRLLFVLDRSEKPLD
ncbi:hypothetical protein HID58_042902 [Brassica napus]|uniref:DNA-directed RNA polymerase subunit 2 hybrid-binding domain-containing protein n=1 Tax=Brassica napus TaxID=3708 RepID=A0ABQ8BEZ1_BRANA|nr:hypothetical protein HID58_042902 [Brassica napus]